MKNILRKFSLNSVNKLEKENSGINPSTGDQSCLLTVNKRHSHSVSRSNNMTYDDFIQNINNTNVREYSVPSKPHTKVSIRSLLSKNRSSSASRAVVKVMENEHIPLSNEDYSAKTRNDKVRLRSSHQSSMDTTNSTSNDILLLRRRFSELNIPTNNSSFLSPPSFVTGNRVSRLSVANIGTDPNMSRRQKRHSLSEFGFGKVESYSKFEILGKGTYSTVYKGHSLLTKDIVALKEVKLEEAEGAPCTAIREISLLRDLRHPNIVTLHDIIYQKNYLTLVFEYMEKNLKQYMEERNNNIDISVIKSFMFQLLSGLEFCHHRRILHRDLKPQNLLINEKNELKLADFGLARAKSIPTKTYSNEVVTLWYRPPDLLLGKTDYSGHVDIWGAGCIFVEMLNGRALFQGQTEEHQLNLIFEKLGSLTDIEWNSLELTKPKFQFKDFLFTAKPSTLIYLVFRENETDDAELDDLLHGFLHPIGDHRLTANQALQYPYFYQTSKKLSEASLPSCDSSQSMQSHSYGSPNDCYLISNI